MEGILQYVTVDSLGSTLLTNASIGDSVLSVDWPADFGDEGELVLNGITYAYAAVDVYGNTITLAAGVTLTAAAVAGDPITVKTATEEDSEIWRAWVNLEDADQPQPAIIPITARRYYVPGDDQSGSVVPIVVGATGQLEVNDSPGRAASASYDYDLPDPAAVAIDPPTESPTIYSVTGSADALTVYVEPIMPTTLLDYYVNGVLVLADQRATIVNITSDLIPLVADTAYSVTVQAHNSATDADPSTLPAISAGVTGQLNPGMTTTQVVAILAAGTIITGALQFGSNGVLDSTGLTITQLDGRQTYMHADGSGNQFVGQAILDTATVLAGMSIAGNSFLSGLFTLTSGVTDPTNKVGVTSAGWDYVENSGNDYGIGPRGLFDNGTTWIYTDSVLYSGNVNSINKTTGARTLLANMPSHFGPYGGVVKVGTNWYVLGRDGARSGNWYVKVFNSSWVENTGAEFAPLAAPDDSLTIGIDGAGGLLIAKRSVANNLFINPYTTAGASTGSSAYPTWPNATLTGIVKAAVDTATVRYVVSSANGGTRVYATTGARVASEEWPNAFGQLPLGISTDGSNWHALAMDRVATYTNLIGSYDFAYDWGDNDTAGSSGAGTGLTGANTARTRPSPLRTVVLASTAGGLPKRSKLTMSLPSAPQDDLTSDGANTANLYAAVTGNTLVLQTSLATSPAVGGAITALSATYSTLATSGTAPSATNGFAARPGAIGRTVSTALTPGGWMGGLGGDPQIDLRGDGSYRLAGINLDDVAFTTLLTPDGISISSGTIGYQVRNRTMFVIVNVTATTNIFTNAAEITLGAVSGGIPAVLRPARTIGGGARVGGFALGFMTVNTDGSLTIRNDSGAARNTLRATVSYPLT